MFVRIFEDPQSLAGAAVDLIDSSALSDPAMVVALPTGRTPIPMYDELAARHGAGRGTLSQAHAFNLDELVLPASDPASFRQFMARNVWERTGLSQDRSDIPDGEALNLQEECARYEKAIRGAGGLDLAILGLGVDGHVGFNLPGTRRMATHVVSLPAPIADSVGVSPDRRPLRAITMGLGTIGRSRAVLIIATGSAKAAAVRQLLHGEVSDACPASLLRSHRHVSVFLDRAAASLVLWPGMRDFVAGQKLR